MKQHVNWGVLGPGFVATRAVMPALRRIREARVLAVASRDAARAVQVAETFDIPRSYSSYADLLADPEIDAVYIALPNHLHREWAERAAAAGKHVLCEKPLACNAAEAMAMVRAAERSGVRLMEAVMYRFHPRMRRLHDMIASGAAGTVRAIYAAFSFTLAAQENYRRYREMGGGALLDVGSYCVNAARWFAGIEPVEVQAMAEYDSDTGIDRALSGLLRFPSGVIGLVRCGFDVAEQQLLEIAGTAGVIEVPMPFTAWQHDPAPIFWRRGMDWETIDIPPADPYEQMVAQFTAAVREGRATPYLPVESVANMGVLDALGRAALSGQREVVQLHTIA
jgi:xylose dehydrogenase (NAD/NADP)